MPGRQGRLLPAPAPPSAPSSPKTFSFLLALSSDKSVLPPTWLGGGPATGRCSKPKRPPQDAGWR